MNQNSLVLSILLYPCLVLQQFSQDQDYFQNKQKLIMKRHFILLESALSITFMIQYLQVIAILEKLSYDINNSFFIVEIIVSTLGYQERQKLIQDILEVLQINRERKYFLLIYYIFILVLLQNRSSTSQKHYENSLVFEQNPIVRNHFNVPQTILLFYLIYDTFEFKIMKQIFVIGHHRNNHLNGFVQAMISISKQHLCLKT
ncbi:hypothetical protein pb186bvf_014264 [Paramecium bursaria]